MAKDEALKLALEALESLIFNKPFEYNYTGVISAIEEALAQRTWVGLTDEEIKTIEEMALTKRMAIEMTIAIVKEKNT